MANTEYKNSVFYFLDLLCDALISVKCRPEIVQEIKLDSAAYNSYLDFVKTFNHKENTVIYRGFTFLIKEVK